MILTLKFPLILILFTIHGLALISSSIKPHSSITSITNNTTTSFLTFFYQDRPSSLRRRQTYASRAVNNCRSRRATFVHSHCLHSPSLVGSMQTFVVFCRENGAESDTRTPNSDEQLQTTPTVPRIPRPTAESGSCTQDEICVNGKVPGGWGTSMAWCVGRDWFVEVPDVNKGLKKLVLKKEQGAEQATLMVSAVFSDGKGITPIRAQEMEVTYEDPGTDTLANSVSSSASEKTKTCTDCFELITPDFSSETSLLTADATVAGTATAAGILWLAILSG